MSRNSENVKNWRKRTKRIIVEAMGGECQCCGYSRCIEALELHHIDPSKKELSFGKIRANPRTLTVIVNELKKCILLCAICHREVHVGVRELPEIYHTLDETKLISRHDELKKEKEKSIDKVRFSKNKPVVQKFFLTPEEARSILHSQFGGNYRAMGRSYGVSDNTIRKRINKLNGRLIALGATSF